jgi:ABC-type nitrate/sulfonate/bicarbonate transport system substrate-binding protein
MNRLLIACLALLLGACAPAPTAPAAKSTVATTTPATLTRLRFRYPVNTGAWLPFMVAKESRIYEKYGLDVDIGMVRGTEQVPAVLAGESDVGGNSGETVTAAIASGAPLVAFGAMIPQAQGFLTVTPDVTQVENLRGSIVVVTGFGNVGEFGLRRIFALYGMNLDTDATIQQVGDTPAEIAALQTRQAKAFMAYPPDDVLASRTDPGLHTIFDLNQQNIPYVQATLFTRREYLTNNRETLTRFMQGTVEAIAYMKRDRAFATQTFIKYTNLDQPAADRAVEWYAETMQDVPAISAEGLKTVISVVAQRVPNAANLDPATMLDTSITDELTRNGFADQFKH